MRTLIVKRTLKTENGSLFLRIAHCLPILFIQYDTVLLFMKTETRWLLKLRVPGGAAQMQTKIFIQ